ncbi:MAG: hypothetical protein J0H84_20075 [Rhizobiales bacterium]|nr:hypothetical protein [Hyphomicrobiales bacterium]
MRIGHFSIMLLCALTGCAADTPGKSDTALIGPLPSAGIVQTTTAYQSITVTEAAPTGATLLGKVTGTACKNSMFDPPPTKETAVIQLRQKAANMGASGVYGITYGTDPNPVSKNCWAIITATGTAYSVK